jgi:hypothetical protein
MSCTARPRLRRGVVRNAHYTHYRTKPLRSGGRPSKARVPSRTGNRTCRPRDPSSGSEVGARGGFAGPSRKSASEVRVGRRNPKSEVRLPKSESEVRIRVGGFGLHAGRERTAPAPMRARCCSTAWQACSIDWALGGEAWVRSAANRLVARAPCVASPPLRASSRRVSSTAVDKTLTLGASTKRSLHTTESVPRCGWGCATNSRRVPRNSRSIERSPHSIPTNTDSIF